MRRFIEVAVFFAVAAVIGRTATAQSFNLGQNSLSFSANAGTSTGSQQVTLFNLTASSLGISLNSSTQSGGNWLSASITPNPVAGNGQGTITVSVNSSTLPVANYSGTVTVSGGGEMQQISVTLSISGVNISAPSSLNTTVLLGQQVPISVLVSGGPATVLISSSVSWLMPDAQVNAPGTFSVTVNASNLSAGNHSGSLSLQCAPGGSPCLPVAISVTVTVTQPTTLVANQTVLTFQASQGGSNPPPQALQIKTSDGTPLAFTLSANQSWLDVSASSTTASSSPAVLTVTVSTAGLTVGANSGTITVQPSNDTTPVAIAVTATLSPVPILVTPNPVSTLTVGAGQMRSITLQVASAGGSALGVAITPTTQKGGNWLQAPATLTTPGPLNVTIDATQLTVGNYAGALTFSCTTTTCSPVSVAINISVVTFAKIVANPAILSFQAGPNNALPSSQTVNVTASDQSAQSFAVSFLPTGSWLNVTANQYTTPATLTVSLASLPALNSTGSITITPANGSAVVTIPVAFGPGPVILPGGVVTASAFGGFNSIASGTYLEVYGSNLSTTTRGWQASDFLGNQAPTILDGVSATINGQSAFVNYVSPGQVNLVAPDNIGTGAGQLILTNSNGTATPYTVQISAVAPGLLAPSAFIIGGKQYVVALFSDGVTYVLPVGAIPNVTSRPAKPGDTIVLYGLGFGPVNPSVPAGTITPQLTKLVSPLQILFGQTPATTISYAGLVPPYVGLYQFNVVVPPVSDNDAVELTFNIGGTASTQTLYFAVQN
jgi:uncharacterized protein (TIGR03437 family)